MNKQIPIGLLAMAVMLSMTRVAVASTEPDTQSKSRVAQYLLDELRTMNGVPGLSAAVRVEGGKVWTGVSGWADAQEKIPVTVNTRFRLASVSKLLTAALALRLSEREIIDLNADVRATFPQLPETFNDISMVHLAAHTSGMAHYTGADSRDAGKHYESLEETLPIYAGRTPLSRPGASYNYSSWGYALLGAIIERKTKLGFDQALAKHILVPLHLNETFIEDVNNLPIEATLLYAQPTDRIVAIAPSDQSYAVGATGIRSTTSDMVRFGSAYGKGEVVGETARDLSWTPYELTDGKLAGNARFSVGFGWRLGRDWDNRPVAHHAGVTPGARSILLVYTETNTVVALLSNASWTSRIETTAELLAAPFMESFASGESSCPSGVWIYQGNFESSPKLDPGAAAARGQLTIDDSDGTCKGKIQPQGALATWMAGRYTGVDYLAMGQVAERDGAKVFAFVTPWGLSPLHISIDAIGRLIARGDIAGKPLSFVASPVSSSAARRNL